MRNATSLGAMQTMQSSTPIPSSPVPGTHIVKDGPPVPGSQVVEDEPLVPEKTPLICEEPDVSTEAQELEPSPAATVAPPLLDELGALEKLVVDRRLRLKTALRLAGKRNRYFVKTEDGEVLYTVAEDSSWWTGYVLCGIRPMTLTFVNAEGREVIRLVRPFSLTTRLVPCALQRMQIFSPPDTCIGSVEQLWSALRPLYIVKNQVDQVVFGVSGPRMTVHFCRDVRFKVARIQDGSVMATTTKRWQGMKHAIFMSSITGRFTVDLGRELSLEEKALVLATTILMDYMYYDI